jgi:AsmA protein
VTAASGFKRLGLAIVAFGAAVVAVVAVLSALIPRGAVRDAVTAELRTVTGLDPVLHGATSVNLFPSSDISFYNVRFGDGQADQALTVERLTARLRLIPLLLGRVEISDVELVEPTIAVTIGPDGKTNWSNLIETLARTLKPTAEAATFSEIRIVDGTILLRDPAHGLSETLNDVDLALAWPSISKSFAATGRFVWRDEPIDASVSLSDFFAALVGNQSGLKLRLSGKPLKVAFDGHMGYAPTLRVDGTLAADSASLRNVLRWAGQRPLPGGGFGRFALKAQTKIVGGNVALTGVNVELDGNTAEGVLTYASDKRRSLQGTLAVEGLDLTPYVSTVRLLTGRQRDWSGLPISLDGLNGFDLDLRLSAAQVTVSSVKFGRTAIAANLRSGKLTVTVGESQAFGGIIKGSFGIGAVDPGAAVNAQLQFADVDLESCLGALFGLHRLEGKGTISVALNATGASVLALTRSMSGSASLNGQAGALAGLNVEQLLRRLERRPLSGGGDFRTGQTPFDKLTVALNVKQGTVNVDTMRIDGAAVRLAIGGSASIPERELDLKGTASLVTKTAADRSFELPFVVQGPWDDPIMLPDADILIRHSGAAAPLLNAVRDRRNRDALRSAIDRLTGRPSPAAAAVTPAQAD